MALKQYNPTSPGQRGLVLVDRSELHPGKPEKSLVVGLTKSGGRGGGGRIAVRFRGGGEGKTSGGRHPVTPWGVPTKGHKTRTNKATDKLIIRSRHVKKAR